MKKTFITSLMFMFLIIISLNIVSAQRVDCPYFLVDNLCVYGVNETMTYAEAENYCDIDLHGHTWVVASVNDYLRVFGDCPDNLSPHFTDCVQWLHYEYFYVNGFVQNSNFVPGKYWTSDDPYAGTWAERLAFDIELVTSVYDRIVLDLEQKVVTENDSYFQGSVGRTKGLFPHDKYVMCKSLSYAYYVGEITVDDPSTPSWFPNPPVRERGIWILLIIIAIVAFISFSNTGESMLSNPYVGVALIIGCMIMFTVLGWIPMWLMLVLLLFIVMYIIYSSKSGGSE